MYAIMRFMGWARGHSDGAVCLTCNRRIQLKPTDCQEPKHRAYYDNRISRNNAYRRRRRAEEREKGRVYQKGRGNPGNKRRRAQANYVGLRSQVMELLGGCQCSECGFADSRALELHHIHGGGSIHRQQGSGSKYLRGLLEITKERLRESVQVLCANCHAIETNEQTQTRSTKTD